MIICHKVLHCVLLSVLSAAMKHYINASMIPGYYTKECFIAAYRTERKHNEDLVGYNDCTNSRNSKHRNGNESCGIWKENVNISQLKIGKIC